MDRLSRSSHPKFCTTKKVNKKKVSRAKTKRKQKAAKRKIRRKQTKIKYYKTLNQIRYQSITEDLCSAVDYFGITDMDWAPAKSSLTLSSEVTDWHKQEQIAYWKSRAISLEMENKMLKQHLRNVYAQTLIDCSVEATEEEPQQKLRNNKKVEKEVVPNLPDPELKYRIEEMRKIYGDKAEKLISIETGIQMNYDRHVEEFKPPFWPTLPLKF